MRRPKMRKWLIIGISFVVVIGLAVFGYQFASQEGNFFSEEESYDVNELLDYDYQAEVTETEEGMHVTILSESLSEEEALELVLHVREQEGEPVTGYVFADENREFLDEQIDFYQEGLRWTIEENSSEEYSVLEFQTLPEVDPNIEMVEAWEIESEEAENNGVTYYGVLDQVATDEEAFAQIKGIAEDKEMSNVEGDLPQVFHIQRGSDHLVYHTSYEDVLAFESTYSVQVETTPLRNE